MIPVVVDVPESHILGIFEDALKTHAFRDVQKLSASQVHQQERAITLNQATGSLEDVQIPIIVDVAHADVKRLARIADLLGSGILKMALAAV